MLTKWPLALFESDFFNSSASTNAVTKPLCNLFPNELLSVIKPESKSKLYVLSTLTWPILVNLINHYVLEGDRALLRVGLVRGLVNTTRERASLRGETVYVELLASRIVALKMQLAKLLFGDILQ